MALLQASIVIAMSIAFGCTEETNDSSEVSNSKLCNLEKDVLSLKTLIANQDTTIARQNIRIAEMSLKNYKLDTKVSALTEQLINKELELEAANKKLNLTRPCNLDIVAFMAAPNKTIETSTHHGLILFDKVITNVGNAYNPITGMFTSPSNGVYYFQWSVTAFRKTKPVTELVVNGEGIIRNHADNLSLGQSTSPSTITAIVELQEGDKVWIRKSGNNPSKIYEHPWSAFNGHKLYGCL